MILKLCEAEIQWCVPRRQRATARKWGWKAAKAGHGRLCWRLPSELPPDTSPWHPQPLAVPAGLSLCGRHVWSWLAGVLAWRSHLSIIDFPPFLSFLSLCFLCLLHTTALLFLLSLPLPLLLVSMFSSLSLSICLISLPLQPLILLCYHHLLLLLTPVLFLPLPPIPKSPVCSAFNPPMFLTLWPFFSLYTSYLTTSPVCK